MASSQIAQPATCCSSEGDLVAQPFDLRLSKLSGMVTTLTDNVGDDQPDTSFRPADDSLLAKSIGDGDMRDLVTSGGHRTERDATANWRNPALSPNDQQIAVERREYGSDASDIWLLPAASGRGIMLASGRPNGAIMPVWRDRLLWFLRRYDGVIERSADAGPERRVRAYDNARNDLTLVNGSITGSTLDGRILGFGLGSNPPATDRRAWPAERTGRRRRRLPAKASPRYFRTKWLAYVFTGIEHHSKYGSKRSRMVE